MDGRARVEVVPLTLPAANELVARLHRHHAPIPAGFVWWSVGAVVCGELAGCAIAGRPTNRNNDDGQTVEVLRVATDGTPNAPSALLGACARAARAIGARRIITYTLDSETGASLRGAGWVREADGITSSCLATSTFPPFHPVRRTEMYLLSTTLGNTDERGVYPYARSMLHEVNTTAERRELEAHYDRVSRVTSRYAHQWVRDGGNHNTGLYLDHMNRIRKARGE